MYKLIILFGLMQVTLASFNTYSQVSDEFTNGMNNYLLNASKFKGQFEYKKAILTYDSAIKIAQAKDAKLWFAHLLCLKARSYLIASKLDSAKVYAEKALFQSKQIKNDTIQGMSLLSLGSVLRKKGDLDSAKSCYTNALELMERANDTIGMGKVLQAFSILYKYTGDYDKGLECALKSNYLYKKIGNRNKYSRSLIDLANIYEQLKEYDTALACYEESYSLSLEENLPKVAATCLYNKGVVYYRLGKYNLSEAEFIRAIAFNDSIHDSVELTRIHNSISIVYYTIDNEEKLKYHLNRSLEIAKKLDLPDATMRALNTYGMYYRKKKAYEEALSYYLESLKMAKQLKSKKGVASAASNTSLVYEDMGNYKDALSLFKLSTDYNDSIFNEVKQREIEKHKTDFEILHLKDQNQIKELDKKRIRAERNTTFGLSVLIVIVLFSLLIFLRMRARKNRIIAAQKIQKLEDEKKLMAAQSVLVGQEKERERIARELHDGIGVLLSTASIHFSSVEAQADAKTGEMMKKANKLLKEAGHEVRQISHNMMPGVLSKFGLKEAIEDLFEDVEEVGGIEVDLDIVCRDDQRLPENMEIMIYRIVQEMLNNTIKYAKASVISFHISRCEEMINMEYKDNGIGFNEAKIPHGKNLGISGIRSRVEYLGGKTELYSKYGEGARYLITIPLSEGINESRQKHKK